ncbi:MAG: hypothetical protein NVSMB18_14580 [Acetobacteraceae bacterium]
MAIHYRRGQPAAAEWATSLAGELQAQGVQPDLRPGAVGFRLPTVTYQRSEDRAAALALAERLRGQGSPWNVRQGRSRAGGLAIWIP